jgi:hypothetical protein
MDKIGSGILQVPT